MAAQGRVSLLARSVHRLSGLGAQFFGGSYGRSPERFELPEETTSSTSAWPHVHVLSWPGRSGTPVVLLHGLASNAWVWGAVGSALGQHGPVFAPTLPGHGRSAASGSGYSSEVMAGMLLPFINQVAADRLVLVGHSWGGKIAVVLAAMLGQRLKGLVLADPVPPQGLNSVTRLFSGVARAIFEPELGPFESQQAMEKSLRSMLYLRKWGTVERKIAEHSFVQREDGAWVHVLPSACFDEILKNCFFEDTRSFVSGIRCPTLIVKPDYTLSPLPGELSCLTGAGIDITENHISGDHDFNVTNPIDTAVIISDFIRQTT